MVTKLNSIRTNWLFGEFIWPINYNKYVILFKKLKSKNLIITARQSAKMSTEFTKFFAMDKYSNLQQMVMLMSGLKNDALEASKT